MMEELRDEGVEGRQERKSDGINISRRFSKNVLNSVVNLSGLCADKLQWGSSYAAIS